MQKLRVFTAFSGYDSQLLALERLRGAYPDFQYECVGWSEIDKNAIKAHDALFPDIRKFNFGDISKIDWTQVPNFDLFTYSFPCTDISMAGRQQGLDESSGTRSSLLWQCRKAIIAKRPKYLLMENVKALTYKKFLPYLQKWLSELVSYGYSNNVAVLNAKDYGVPQNRERVFVWSTLGNERFAFPEKRPLTKRLSDVLEKEVDESFYLRDEVVKMFIAKTAQCKQDGKGFMFRPMTGEGVCGTLVASWLGSYSGCYVKQIGNVVDTRTRQGQIQNYHERTEAGTIHSSTGSGGNTDQYVVSNPSTRIRKLTPRECFRLMGVADKDIDTIQSSGICKTQQHKLAGNSIVVDVLYEILKRGLIERGGAE